MLLQWCAYSPLEVFYDDALYKSTLSIYLSIYLSVCLSICLSVSVCLSVCLSVYLQFIGIIIIIIIIWKFVSAPITVKNIGAWQCTCGKKGIKTHFIFQLLYTQRFVPDWFDALSGFVWCQEMIEWYTAIRAAKLNRLAIAYPSAQVDEVQIYIFLGGLWSAVGRFSIVQTSISYTVSSVKCNSTVWVPGLVE